MSLKTISKYYTLTAILLFNIFLFFVLVNAFSFIIFKINNYFKEKNIVAEKYGESILKEVYPDWSGEEIDKLLNETWSRNFTYEPFTQFKERPFSGKYVNVDKNGFRVTKNQGPWPPDSENFNIFLFGGSTTFNYGLPDEQTIASYLQDYLSEVSLGKKRVAVYNFGRGNYFSTQERILFEQLLASDFRPNLAIFIDGLNEFYYPEDKPVFTKQLEQIVGERVQALKYLTGQALEKLPMTKAALFLRDLIFKKEISGNEEKYNDPELIKSVINRYLENKKLIEGAAAVYNVKTVFVWQPSPLYKYDLKYHPFAKEDFERHTYSKYGYPQMAKVKEEKSLGNNFLWAADIQEQERKSLYVDMVHYTAKMSQTIAKIISNFLIEKNFYDQLLGS